MFARARAPLVVQLISTSGEILIGSMLILIRGSLIALTRRLILIRPSLILITRGLIAITRRLIPAACGKARLPTPKLGPAGPAGSNTLFRAADWTDRGDRHLLAPGSERSPGGTSL